MLDYGSVGVSVYIVWDEMRVSLGTACGVCVAGEWLHLALCRVKGLVGESSVAR